MVYELNGEKMLSRVNENVYLISYVFSERAQCVNSSNSSEMQI